MRDDTTTESPLRILLGGKMCECGGDVIISLCSNKYLVKKFPTAKHVTRCTIADCIHHEVVEYSDDNPPTWIVSNKSKWECVNNDRPYDYCAVANGRCVSYKDGVYMRDKCISLKDS